MVLRDTSPVQINPVKPSGGVTPGRLRPVPGGIPWRQRYRARRAPVMIWLPAVVIALLLLLPIGYLIVRAADAGDDVWGLIFRQRTATIFWNTVRLAAGVGGTTIAIAVPLAWLVTRTDLPFRKFWSTIAALPLVIPSYAGALAVIGALGPRGFVQGWLEPLGVEKLPSIYGYLGAWAMLSLFTYPYVFLAVRAMLRQMDPALEEASQSLGRGTVKTFLTVTVPRLRPAIAAGALLAMLYTVSDFGVVTLMRYDAFTRAIYTQYRAAFDRTYAAALGILLVVFALALLVFEARMRGKAAYHRIGSGTGRAPKLIRLGKMRYVALAFTSLIALLSLGIPIGALVYWMITGTSTGRDLDKIPAAIGNSLLVGALAALVVTALAMPVALLIVRYPGKLSRITERLTYVGYALPGIVVALAFVFMGARFMLPIYQTLPLLVLALAIRLIPQGVGSIKSSLLQINPRLEDASRCLGCTVYASVRRVSWPLAWPGIAAGAALVFLTVLKELPITLLLRPTGFDTLATDIWDATGAGQYGRAATSALVLIAISAIPTLILTGRNETRVPSEANLNQ
jgi:iron(III) transport system permease protein